MFPWNSKYFTHSPLSPFKDFGCSSYNKKGQISIPINREGTQQKLPRGDYSVYAAYRGNKQEIFAPDGKLNSIFVASL